MGFDSLWFFAKCKSPFRTLSGVKNLKLQIFDKFDLKQRPLLNQYIPFVLDSMD